MLSRYGSNMSRKYGTQWKPCERTNGSIMMRINPEPVVLTGKDIVLDLTYMTFGNSLYDEILMMNKSQFKKELTHLANRRAYYHDGYEQEYLHTPKWERAYFNIATKLLEFFPQFEKVMCQRGKYVVAYVKEASR